MGYNYTMPTPCEHCKVPVELDEFGTPLHTEGPTESSFVCHVEGDPNCDCWNCEEIRLAG